MSPVKLRVRFATLGSIAWKKTNLQKKIMTILFFVTVYNLLSAYRFKVYVYFDIN